MDPFGDVLDANRAYAATFSGRDLPAAPRRHLAVLTCMDCRIDVHEAFGVRIGEAHVLRNAGARASDDAIRSLIKSTNQLEVNRIAIVHHTQCGAAKITRPELRARVLSRSGADPADVEFHLIGDPDAALLDDVERIRTCPYLPAGTVVGGFRYDVETGALTSCLRAEVGGTATRAHS